MQASLPVCFETKSAMDSYKMSPTLAPALLLAAHITLVKDAACFSTMRTVFVSWYVTK